MGEEEREERSRAREQPVVVLHKARGGEGESRRREEESTRRGEEVTHHSRCRRRWPIIAINGPPSPLVREDDSRRRGVDKGLGTEESSIGRWQFVNTWWLFK